ncbi:uncharacterized protein LOC135146246 [Zophobas morio]|uniref:uncharacterized protein LOC135146246 n=1 Tax=Zophobas morio TaxID=2755281 RepID=UPI0030830169
MAARLPRLVSLGCKSFRSPFRNLLSFSRANILSSYNTKLSYLPLRYNSHAVAKLKKSVESEIKHENEHLGEKFPDLGQFAKKLNYTVEHVYGEKTVKLTRKVDDHLIVVEFVVDDDYAQPFDENEDMGMEGQNEGENEAQFKDYDDSTSSFSCDITISKPSKPEAGILICSLEIHSEDFELFSVQYVKNLEDSENSYRGPKLTELDESLNSALVKYLNFLGINSDLAGAIAIIREEKEKREYLLWLEGLKKFISH